MSQHILLLQTLYLLYPNANLIPYLCAYCKTNPNNIIKIVVVALVQGRNSYILVWGNEGESLIESRVQILLCMREKDNQMM